MTYTVILSKEAIKELDRLDTKIVRRLERRFEELSLAPFDLHLSDKVIMHPEQRYSRVGDRRIFFEVDDQAKTVDIIAIRPRGRAYPKGK